MKKFLTILAAFSLSLCHQTLPAASSGSYDYEEERDDFAPRSGIGSADASTTAISISMVGWGVGLTVAIAAIVILVPPDEEGTTHTHSS